MLTKTLPYIVRHPLSKGCTAHNIARYFAWQAISRVWPRPIAFELVDGAKMYASRGLHGATGNLYVGLHEAEEMAFVLHTLMPGDRFCDIGANVGSYSVLAASRGAQVVAFEPSDQAFGWLLRNIELNATNLIAPHKIALADCAGQGAFISTKGTENRLDPYGDMSVSVDTLDRASGDTGFAVIKIDVEDGGQRVLAGAHETLSRDGLLAVVGELTGHEAVAILKTYGFTPYAYDMRARALQSLSTVSHKGNAIFIRNRDLTLKRLREAKPFVVRGRSY